MSAPDATAVWVCLFDDDGTETRYQLTEHTLGVWHGQLPGVPVGQLYGFRADGPWDPRHGLRYNPHKLLLDPYARAITGEPTRGWRCSTTTADAHPQRRRLRAVHAAQRRRARRLRLGATTGRCGSGGATP